MVLDEKFGDDEDASKLLIFAEKNPTLAGFVRRFQRKLVPCVGSWSWVFNTSMASKFIIESTKRYDPDFGLSDLRDHPSYLGAED